MADEWSDYFEELFEPDPRDYEDLLFGNADDVDAYAQQLFSDWMGSGFTDNEALGKLSDYMWETYDIDFEEVFDWEDFREWYDSQ